MAAGMSRKTWKLVNTSVSYILKFVIVSKIALSLTTNYSLSKERRQHLQQVKLTRTSHTTVKDKYDQKSSRLEKQIDKIMLLLDLNRCL